MLPLARWNPWREVTSLHKEIDEMFNRFFGRTERFGLPLLTSSYGFPAIDCAKVGDNLVIHVDIPGIDPKDVDISVVGNVLTIKGERKTHKEVKEEDYLMREIGYGAFERNLTLPEGVNTDKIKAGYNNGILEITMPAEAVQRGKKVQIEVPEELKKLKAA